MRPLLHDTAAVEHDDHVRVADRAQPVGHDDAGAAALPQAVVDLQLGYRIERRGGFVEHQDGGVGHERAGDLQTLALPAAEVAAVLLDRGVVLAGAGHDLVVDLGVAQGAGHGVVLDEGVPQGHVVAHAALEEDDFLVDVRDCLHQVGGGDVLDGASVDPHDAGPRLQQSAHQLAEGGLAAAGAADEGHPLAGFDRQAEALDERRLAEVVAEGDVLEGDEAAAGERGPPREAPPIPRAARASGSWFSTSSSRATSPLTV